LITDDVTTLFIIPETTSIISETSGTSRSDPIVAIGAGVGGALVFVILLVVIVVVLVLLVSSKRRAEKPYQAHPGTLK
jgi:hypothetical protein